MRLVVVSHTEHRVGADGELRGWQPTVRELDHLATSFDEVVHIAFLHEGEPLAGHRPYAGGRVRVRPLRPAGGSLAGRFLVLLRAPGWMRAVAAELRHADAVHVRCPAGISLLTVLLLALVPRPRPRWIKYAGNWKPEGQEPVSYRLQRWLLRRDVARAAVTVNGRWAGDPAHVYAFDNPSLTDDELAAARGAAGRKPGPPPLRLLFAGRLEESKGAGRAIAVAHGLAEHGVPFHLDLAGDGPDRGRYTKLVDRAALQRQVRFHGWMPREALDALYRDAHVLLLPTASEGFPKVIGEAMAHGLVPVTTAVSSIPQVLAEAGAGFALEPGDIAGAVEAARSLAVPEEWHRHSCAASRAADRFTYRRYLEAVRGLFSERWGAELLRRPEP